MDKVKKEHYIPQSYLIAFSKDGRIACYDKTLNKFFPTNITDIAESRYFYDPDTNITTREEQVFDIALEGVESQNAPILKRLRDICSKSSNLYSALIINGSERADLSIFMCLQMFRTKKFREELHNMYDGFLLQLAELYESYINSPYKLRYSINDKAVHLEYLFDNQNIMAYSSFLFESHWIFYLNLTDVPFITSDNPIFRIPRFYDSPECGTEIPFLNDRLELYYPISPIVTIHLLRRESHEYERLRRYRNRLLPISDPEFVHCINQINIHRAHERIFYGREHEALIKKYVNEKPEFTQEHTRI